MTYLLDFLVVFVALLTCAISACGSSLAIVAFSTLLSIGSVTGASTTGRVSASGSTDLGLESITAPCSGKVGCGLDPLFQSAEGILRSSVLQGGLAGLLLINGNLRELGNLGLDEPESLASPYTSGSIPVGILVNIDVNLSRQLLDLVPKCQNIVAWHCPSPERKALHDC